MQPYKSLDGVSTTTMSIQLQWSAVAPLQPFQSKNLHPWSDLIQAVQDRVAVSQLLLLFPSRRLIVHVDRCLCGDGLLFSLTFLSNFVTSEAAADGRLGDQTVERFERVHPLGQEVPGPQLGGQVTGATSLHHIHHDDEDDDAQKGATDAGHHLPARQREAQHQRWKEQETEQEVQHSKPAVFGRALPQDVSHPDWQTHEGKRIPQQDTKDVEDEVTQSNLGAKK